MWFKYDAQKDSESNYAYFCFISSKKPNNPKSIKSLCMQHAAFEFFSDPLIHFLIIFLYYFTDIFMQSPTFVRI